MRVRRRCRTPHLELRAAPACLPRQDRLGREADGANGDRALSFGVVRSRHGRWMPASERRRSHPTFRVSNASVQGAQAVLIQPDGQDTGRRGEHNGNPSGTTGPGALGALPGQRQRQNRHVIRPRRAGAGRQLRLHRARPGANGDIFTGQPFRVKPDRHQTRPSRQRQHQRLARGTSHSCPAARCDGPATVVIIRRHRQSTQVQRFNADGQRSARRLFDYAGTSGLVTRDTGAAVAVQANGQAVPDGGHAEPPRTTQDVGGRPGTVNADGSLDGRGVRRRRVLTQDPGQRRRARAAHSQTARSLPSGDRRTRGRDRH